MIRIGFAEVVSRDNGDEDGMGSRVVGFLWWADVERRVEGYGVVDLGGLCVLLVHAEVAFACGQGLEEVLGD